MNSDKQGLEAYVMPYFHFDYAAIAVFAILARIAHGGLNVLEILFTFFTFAMGTSLAWANQIRRLASPESRAKAPHSSSVRFGIQVWLATVIGGLFIWSLINDNAIPHWSFVLVASFFSGLFIIGWRVIYGFIKR
ncbi:DUF3054 domain-containing protein [Corynebacterium sp. sy039]|uniref:DUF3054 domain-containing protein n=1 Tax=Corynebacterium sp. sy039 TaxID=2599641 RepID=UPI001FF056DB|nr:DUF3054 domain-containing protein [Corynebacterium sp. sy039]